MIEFILAIVGVVVLGGGFSCLLSWLVDGHGERRAVKKEAERRVRAGYKRPVEQESEQEQAARED